MDIFPWLKGFGSEGFILNLILSAFIAWHVFIKPKIMKRQGKDRRKPANPNDRPGKATECLKHMEKLIELETKITNFDGWLEKIEANNRQDHQKINDKIDKIRNNRR